MSTTPTCEHAAGMFEALVASHTCGRACNSEQVIGRMSPNPQTIRLRCPLSQIDLDNPADRRTVQSMYAAEARAAMGKTS